MKLLQVQFKYLNLLPWKDRKAGEEPMCWLSNRQKTVEEIVAEKSVGMSNAQKAEYWYNLSQNIFALLDKVEVPVFELAPAGTSG